MNNNYIDNSNFVMKGLQLATPSLSLAIPAERGIMRTFLHSMPIYTGLRNHQPDAQRTQRLTQLFIHIVLLADAYGLCLASAFIPQREYQYLKLAAPLLLLINNIFFTLNTMKHSFIYAKDALSTHDSHTRKTLLVASAILLIYGGKDTLQHGTTVLHGTQLLGASMSLGSTQQFGVLKHRLIEVPLRQEQLCNSVVLMQEPIDMFTSSPDSSMQTLYQHCNIRFFAPNSLQEFCDSLAQSAVNLNQPIDILVIEGYGDQKSVTLGRNFTLSAADKTARGCMQRYLGQSAEIVLKSDHSAQEEDMEPVSMARAFSSALENRTVVGFTTNYYTNPLLSNANFENGRLNYYTAKFFFNVPAAFYNGNII